MDDILFLCHRIPYPPNKGDKIRSYHWLQHLKQHYKVHLGAFVDDVDDWQYRDKVSEGVAEVLLLPRSPWLGKIKCISGFISQSPLTLSFYASSRMQRWVDRVVRNYPGIKILLYSSVMAQYVEHIDNFRVMDFVDIDSSKWLQYANEYTGVKSWIYRREHQTLEAYEKKIAKEFDLSLFVSTRESMLFKRLQPRHLHYKVKALSNGIDLSFFDPFDSDINTPYLAGQQPIVFTGAMDYKANEDAVVWFAQTIFPHIRSQFPKVVFYIVGSNPSRKVQSLAQIMGVSVTGRVADVRPYLLHCCFAVAPLRISQGVQNKVLEALAMNKTVVGTASAFEGIGNPAAGIVVDDEKSWISGCGTALCQDLPMPTSRDWVGQRFSWQKSFVLLSQHFSPLGEEQ